MKRSQVILFAISSLYLTGCILGFIYQVYLVSSLYFKYSANSEIKIEFDTVFKSKAISICTRFTDHLDFERIRRDNPQRRDWHHTYNRPWIPRYQHELSIAEIFNYTPSAKETLGNVRVRKDSSDSYLVIPVDKSAAYDYFEVKKFLYLENVCYAYWQRNFSDGMSYTSLAASTPYSSGIIFSLYFNTSMQKAHYLKIAIHDTSSTVGFYPYRDLMVAPGMSRNYNITSQTAKYNAYIIYDVNLEIHNLPPPYQTKCRDYKTSGLDSEQDCIQECMSQHITQKLNKMPFSVIINTPTNMQMVSYQDIISNLSISKIISDTEHYCTQRICFQKPCYQLTTITKITEKVEPHFVVILFVPREPSIKITSKSALDIVEFITYILSVFGTWTGISIISLNPTWLLRRLLKQKRSRININLLLDNQNQIFEMLASHSNRLNELHALCNRNSASSYNSLS